MLKNCVELWSNFLIIWSGTRTFALPWKFNKIFGIIYLLNENKTTIAKPGICVIIAYTYGIICVHYWVKEFWDSLFESSVQSIDLGSLWWSWNWRWYTKTMIAFSNFDRTWTIHFSLVTRTNRFSDKGHTGKKLFWQMTHVRTNWPGSTCKL